MVRAEGTRRVGEAAGRELLDLLKLVLIPDYMVLQAEQKMRKRLAENCTFTILSLVGCHIAKI